MSTEIPHVVRWETYPRDVSEPIPLFKHSLFNYLYKNREANVTMGYWEVEQGEEVAQDAFELSPFHEVIVVLEGQFFVSGETGEEEVARPGDLIMILPGRKTRIRVGGRSRAFFLVFGIDPQEIETTIRS